MSGKVTEEDYAAFYILVHPTASDLSEQITICTFHNQTEPSRALILLSPR